MHNKEPALKTIRPDAKGRIVLGVLAKGVSSFAVQRDGEKIVLIPYVEIPAKEKWLFANKEALAKIHRGLHDSANGRVLKRGSFKKYLNDEID